LSLVSYDRLIEAYARAVYIDMYVDPSMRQMYRSQLIEKISRFV